MQKVVFIIEGRDYGKLKVILAADPYADGSFAKAGYVLRESKAVGLKGGNYVVFVKTQDASLIPKLKERLKPLETAKELDGDDLTRVISQIEGEEDSAAEGLGSIFG